MWFTVPAAAGVRGLLVYIRLRFMSSVITGCAGLSGDKIIGINPKMSR